MGSALYSYVSLHVAMLSRGSSSFTEKVKNVMDIERVDMRRPFRLWWLHSLARAIDDTTDSDWVLSFLLEEMACLQEDDECLREGCWEERVVEWLQCVASFVDSFSWSRESKLAEGWKSVFLVADHVILFERYDM